MKELGTSYVTEKQKIKLSERGELSVIITVPHIEGWEDMNGFYEKMAENCGKFCRDSLPGALSATGHSYRYRLSSEAVAEDRAVRVNIRVTLIDRSRGEVIEKQEICHLWRYGMLVRSIKGKRRSRKSPSAQQQPR